MFHVRYKATTWMDLRLATTRSLSRPNYFDLVPFERLDHRGTSVARGNPDLQHTIAWNYDAFLSIYGNRGLFTLGGFYKRLDDISFIRNTRIQDPNDWFGYSLTSPVNSEEETVVKGFEVELQTNLKTLPNPWDGVVLGLNYSHITSKTFFYCASDVSKQCLCKINIVQCFQTKPPLFFTFRDFAGVTVLVYEEEALPSFEIPCKTAQTYVTGAPA